MQSTKYILTDKSNDWFSFAKEPDSFTDIETFREVDINNYWQSKQSIADIKKVFTEAVDTQHFMLGNVMFKIPISLTNLITTITESRDLMTLEYDWDDEGGKAIDLSTWERAMKFLLNYSLWLNTNYNVVIDIPEISPGPADSIDILWRTDKYRMLVNIPKDLRTQASYYGDDRNDGESIKGNFPTNKIKDHIASWMKNLNSGK